MSPKAKVSGVPYEVELPEKFKETTMDVEQELKSKIDEDKGKLKLIKEELSRLRGLEDSLEQEIEYNEYQLSVILEEHVHDG